MTDYSHILFNKTPLQLPPTPATVSLPALPRHTTAESVAALDARFPWRAAQNGDPRARLRPLVTTREPREPRQSHSGAGPTTK